MEGSLNLPYGLTGTGAFRPGEAAAKIEPTQAYGIVDHYLEEVRKTQQAVEAKRRENSAYGDADFVPRLLNHPDPNVAAIGQGFREAAPDFASVKSGVANGDIHHSWGTDLDNMKRAAETIADFKNRGVSVDDYLDAEYHNPNTDHNFLANLRFIDSISKAYTPEEMGEVIKSQAQNALLGGTRPAPWHIEPPAARTMGSPDQLISSIRARAGRSTFESDPDWMRQATAHDPSERSYAGKALDSLQPYNLDPHAHDATVQVMRQFENRLPPGVKIGALNRVEPTTDPNVVKGLVTDAPDFVNYVRPDFIAKGAAMWDPGTRSVILSRYGTSGFQSLEHFSHGLQSEAVHEIGHAVSALHLSPSERTALINDADRLGVLAVPFNLYSGLKLGRQVSRFGSEQPMGDMYQELYKDRPADMRSQLMDEEAIAVLTELYHHGVVNPNDLSPTTRAILDKITKGGFSK
jgi:hypothetical protein